MDAKTLRALKGSIRKWKLIVAGTGVDRGVENCPLCQMYYEHDCAGCPVAEASGNQNCYDTPYIDWCSSTYDGIAYDDESVMCAVLELEFLKSLLPSKARK